MSIIYFICDIVMIYLLPSTLLGVGWLFDNKKSRKIKSSNELKLSYEKKPKQVWSYVQKITPKIIIKYAIMLGIFVTMLLAVSLITPLEYKTVHLLCTDLGLIIIGLVIYIIAVEKKIRIKFDSNGKLKI